MGGARPNPNAQPTVPTGPSPFELETPKPPANRGAAPPADAYGQTRLCLQIILKALADLGAGAEDVVRTRVYGTRTDIFDEVARAHSEVFSGIQPASAFVVIKELADPIWLVEIEADAIVTA